jgi:hypothetical protein
VEVEGLCLSRVRVIFVPWRCSGGSGSGGGGTFGVWFFFEREGGGRRSSSFVLSGIYVATLVRQLETCCGGKGWYLGR